MKTRRDFLSEGIKLVGGSLLLQSFQLPLKNKHKLGVQLYSFRNEMLEDAKGTLQKIAALGFKQIESAGSDKGYYYGLKPAEMKSICADHGMTLRSGHIIIGDNWQKNIDDAAESGQEYLICAWMDFGNQVTENYKKAAEKFNMIGEACKKVNVKFGYHNHDSEFESDNGKILYEVLLENTDPELVCMEFDVGWVVAAGKNPIDYFKKYPNRFPLWHLKDMKIGAKTSTEFGKGDLDIPEIFRHASLSGLKQFFIEQEDFTNNVMESMKENISYIKNLKLK